MFGGSLAAVLLFETGRPVLFMPPRFSGRVGPGPVVIAWDGSARAARAVGDAMTFIEAAAQVSIVCVTGDKDLSRAAPGGDLAERLARHNRNVTITETALAGGNAGDAILRHAQSVDAGLVVMGAYAHARWRQLVLGGATRTMLQKTMLPVLMAH
jgi:nucleotide-binding universal stress UspA family protein